MFRSIRSLLSLAILAAFVLFAATVPIGKHTLFGHVKRIWSSDEAKELRDSVKEESGPAIDRLERGVKAGIKAAKGDGDAGAKGDTPDTADKPKGDVDGKADDKTAEKPTD